jgi:hypothetical protein
MLTAHFTTAHQIPRSCSHPAGISAQRGRKRACEARVATTGDPIREQSPPATSSEESFEDFTSWRR